MTGHTDLVMSHCQSSDDRSQWRSRNASHWRFSHMCQSHQRLCNNTPFRSFVTPHHTPHHTPPHHTTPHHTTPHPTPHHTTPHHTQALKSCHTEALFHTSNTQCSLLEQSTVRNRQTKNALIVPPALCGAEANFLPSCLGAGKSQSQFPQIPTSVARETARLSENIHFYPRWGSVWKCTYCPATCSSYTRN